MQHSGQHSTVQSVLVESGDVLVVKSCTAVLYTVQCTECSIAVQSCYSYRYVSMAPRLGCTFYNYNSMCHCSAIEFPLECTVLCLVITVCYCSTVELSLQCTVIFLVITMQGVLL